MEVQTIVKIQNNVQDCNFFVYKNKQYPFKFDFFKNASEYFYENKKELKKSKMIPLIEENEEDGFIIPESVIEQFINYVHCQSIPLNSSNITFLSFLAKKYKVSSLINATNEFLEKNHDQLALQILLTRQNQPQIETSTYEDIISSHFDQYIKDQRIFQLNISILYRIFHKFLNNDEQNNSKCDKNEIMDFLFECLDKYGKDASVLFKEINFGDMNSEILDRLMNNYSEIFDFHFVNLNFMKKLYATQSDLLKNQIKQENEMKLIKDLLNQMKSEFQQKQEENKKKEEENRKKEKENCNLVKEEISKMKSKIQQKEENDTNSMKLIKAEINKVKTELLKQRKENKKKEEENSRLTKDEINKLKSEFQKKQEENTKKEEDNMKLIKEEIIKIKTELKNYQSENKNKSLIEELNKIKTFLNRMQTSMIFDNEICREEFNKIDGETQIYL